jgi:hypothetical protein
MILGASVDETTICLDQVSINSLLLQFKYLFMLLVSIFGGVSTLKRSSLGPRGMSYDRSHVHLGRGKIAHVYMQLSTLQPTWTLYLMEKNKKARFNPPELGFLQDVCSLEGKRA